MKKNVSQSEKIVRIIGGVALGLIALLIHAWPGWARIASGIVGVSFVVTALVGY